MKKTTKKSAKNRGVGKKRSAWLKRRKLINKIRRDLLKKYGEEFFQRYSEGLFIDPIWIESETKPGKR